MGIKSKKGVEWVSTVLYTLISLALMGILLAAVQPRIAELKDNYVISQTIDSLNVLDETISNARVAEGTVLKYSMQLQKGNLVIDGQNDRIIWQSDSNYQYSEINKTVTVGVISALTEKKGNGYNVRLEMNYPQINLTFSGSDSWKTFNPASVPYAIWIKNNGIVNKKLWMDLSE